MQPMADRGSGSPVGCSRILKRPASSEALAPPTRPKPLPPQLVAQIAAVLELFELPLPNQLCLAAVTPTTWAKYLLSLRSFHAFCLSRRLSWASPSDVDRAIAEAWYEMYLDGAAIAEAQLLYSAWLAAAPSTGKGAIALPMTLRTKKAWTRRHPATTRAPAPWMVVAAVASTLCGWGRGLEALALCLMFTAYLRPSECLRLEVEDVVPAAPPVSQHVALNLHPEERGVQSKVYATNESVMLDNPKHIFVADALLRARRLAVRGRIFPFSAARLASMFLAAQAALQLPVKYVLYQLRHGGPSEDRRDKLRTPLAVKQRGRWESEASMRRYEAAARLQKEEGRLPAGLRAQILSAGRTLPMVLAGALSPPPAPGAGGASSSSCLLDPHTCRKRRLPQDSRPGPSTSTTAPSTISSAARCLSASAVSSPAPTADSSGWAPPAIPGRVPGIAEEVRRLSETRVTASMAAQGSGTRTARRLTSRTGS